MANGKLITGPAPHRTRESDASSSGEKPAAGSLDASYRLLFDSNPQPMWVYDLATLRFLAVNDAAVLKYGFSRDEFLAMTIEQIRPPTEMAKLRAKIARVREAHQHSGVWRHWKKSGEIIEVEIVSHRLEFEGRDAALVVASDVTARERAQRELRESEQQMRIVFDRAAVGICKVSLEGRWLQVNDRFCEIVGHPREKLLQETWAAITHQDDLADCWSLFKKAVAGELARYDVDKRFVRADGAVVWAHVCVAVVRDETQAPQYLIGVMEDLSEGESAEAAQRSTQDEIEQRIGERTAELRGLNEALLKEIADRREAESGLRTSKELLRCVLDSLPAEIAVLDPHGTVIAVNKVWDRFGQENGGPLNCGLGSNYLECCHRAVESGEVDAAQARSGIACVLDGSLLEFCFSYPCDCDGTERWFTLCATPLSREKGGAVVSHVEITDQHRAETALRASHALMRDIFDGTTDAVYVKDLQGRYTMINEAGAANLGRTPEDVIGKTAREVFEPHTANVLAREDLEIVSTGVTRTFATKMRMLGRDRDFLATKGVCRNEQGDIVGIFGISRDITEINRAKDALSIERNLLRTLVDNLPDAIYVKDSEGRFLVTNSAHTRALGATSPKDVIGKTVFDFLDRADAEKFIVSDHEVIASERAMIEHLEKLRDANGEMRFLSVTKVPFRDAAGKVIGIVGVSRDITERRRAEQQIDRLASIVETSNDAIISTDIAGNVLSWNKAAEQLFGYSAAEMIGQKPIKLSPPELRAETARMQVLVRRGHFVKDLETVRQCKDGRRIQIAMTVSPIQGEEGETLGASAIVRDITERKRLEREILEISDNERRRIGQDLHDDLCQYLVGISLLANVLHDNLAAQKIKEAEDARQINSLVRQAVTKARSIAKGLSPLDLAGTGFIAALQELAQLVQRLFGIQCNFECESMLEIADGAVATHLYRIVQEAVHNAAKHSRGTKITIRLTDEKDAVEIEDDGCGDVLFDPSAATGLGLHTMQYRAGLIGAELTFRRGAQGGMLVRCTLPKCKSR